MSAPSLSGNALILALIHAAGRAVSIYCEGPTYPPGHGKAIVQAVAEAAERAGLTIAVADVRSMVRSLGWDTDPDDLA